MAGEDRSSNPAEALLGGLLFPKISHAFRIALQPSKVLAGLLAVGVITGTGWLMDLAGKAPVMVDGGRVLRMEVDVYVAGENIQAYAQEATGRIGVFRMMWRFGSNRFHDAVYGLLDGDFGRVGANVADALGGVAWLFRYHPVYGILFAAVSFVVFCITGGAICRMAAVQFARGQKVGLFSGLWYGIRRFTSFAGAPLSSVAIMFALGLFIFLIGLLGNIPRAGELLVTVLLFLSLVPGVLITVVFIGLVGGMHLMFPAVAYDGSDSFDAINRSFSYVYARPWRTAFYTVLAAVYGAICYVFVRLFLAVVLWATRWFLALAIFTPASSRETDKLVAIWPEPAFSNLYGRAAVSSANWSEAAASWVVYGYVMLAVGLLAAFVMSFYCSAQTILYGLLRKRVDNTALDDVYMPHVSPVADIEAGDDEE
ncbi:MAG TPA: hypothetical protein ENN81_13630 [Phycisphaerales bacterium]|nr:hypothetical protein [Phycisphaerales bacterium]